MNFELKMTAQTSNELAAMVNSLAAQFGVKLEHPVVIGVPEGVIPAGQVNEEETTSSEEKKTRTRRTKAEIVAEKAKEEEKTEAPAEDTTPSTSNEITLQHIANACQDVSTKKNLQAAKDILAKFKSIEDGEPCRKIKQLSVLDYAAFLAECEKAVK